MTPRQETTNDLKRAGFQLKREGKKHSIYWNPETGQTIPVKRHDFDENDRRYILKEAGIRKQPARSSGSHSPGASVNKKRGAIHEKRISCTSRTY